MLRLHPGYHSFAPVAMTRRYCQQLWYVYSEGGCMHACKPWHAAPYEHCPLCPQPFWTCSPLHADPGMQPLLSTHGVACSEGVAYIRAACSGRLHAWGCMLRRAHTQGAACMQLHAQNRLHARNCMFRRGCMPGAPIVCSALTCRTCTQTSTCGMLLLS